ncbi:HTTM domain-containing protein [Streptomyces sp. H10-C2]|uniref:HTTM domain-containing protein n=1 Tax=unclassified Streptomyces TaxID=2593676 RepID=UPI0024BBA1F7|nr:MULTISPECIES: HTTM domain-containing protein [unclassified Streptomyces]MDJ0340273.1 HTTM domain-containing protein [Streptomyces sp. PH10-H1]MDJ0368279.1 HTTM domain-containing protein [Streptomyces sp. H10-C2]
MGPYQSAVVRIGFSLTWLLFLLREWPHRAELYGPDAVWTWDMAQRLMADNGSGAFSALMWTNSQVWFEVVYVGAIIASALLLVGWRTRTSSVLFMIGVLSLQNRSIFMGDGGDNVIHLMVIYLVLTRCGQVWSLDKRRAERTPTRKPTGKADPDPTGVVLWSGLGAALVLVTLLGKLGWGWALIFWGLWLAQAAWWAVRRYAPGEPSTVLDVLANLAHNGGMLVIVVEVCLIYATAGWYKIQGSRWQDGTALYYPLHLDDFTPWPALSHALASAGLIVMVITYGTVIVQVAFPFTLFNRRVKNVLLVAMIIEHASIAILLGLPFFSLAMIAADAVFLPTNFLRWVGSRIAGLVPGALRAGTRQDRDLDQEPTDGGGAAGGPTGRGPTIGRPAAEPQLAHGERGGAGDGYRV